MTPETITVTGANTGKPLTLITSKILAVESCIESAEWGGRSIACLSKVTTEGGTVFRVHDTREQVELLMKGES